MGGRALAERYLAVVAEHGLTARELLPRHACSDLLWEGSAGKCAPVPAFLGRDEVARLQSDLTNLHDALESLPHKVFGGDFAAFARAVGLAPAQIEFAMRTQAGRPLTRFARADLYADATGFRLLEYNIGTQIGCMEQSHHVEALLRHPVLESFAAEHGLGYVDSMVEYLDTMLVETGHPRPAKPVVGFVDWPGEYVGIQKYGIEMSIDLNNRVYDVDSVCGHLGDVEYRDGRVWMHGRALDVVYRIFMLQHVLDEGGVELIEPLVAAAERGEVRIFAPIGCEAYAAKATLALLCDDQVRQTLTPEQQESVARLIPWTRTTHLGKTTAPDGEHVDLLEFALANRSELALKPTLLHGGAGVVLGWECTDEQWREHLDGAMDGTFILQARIHPLVDHVPGPDGTVTEYVYNWGVFSVAPNERTPTGFGGVAIRSAPAHVGMVGRLSVDPGALFGGALHEL